MTMQNNTEDEKLLPVGTPSPKAQSWGAVISIAIIVMMIIVGAFYAWSNRLAQNSVYPTSMSTTATTS
jgi:nicotinamide riboside transporter PnuC